MIGRIPIRRGHLRLVIFIVHRRNRCSFSPNQISFRRSRNASNKVSNHPRPLLGILQCLRHVHFAVRNQFFQLLRALHWVRLIAAIHAKSKHGTFATKSLREVKLMRADRKPPRTTRLACQILPSLSARTPSGSPSKIVSAFSLGGGGGPSNAFFFKFSSFFPLFVNCQGMTNTMPSGKTSLRCTAACSTTAAPIDAPPKINFCFFSFPFSY